MKIKCEFQINNVFLKVYKCTLHNLSHALLKHIYTKGFTVYLKINLTLNAEVYLIYWAGLLEIEISEKIASAVSCEKVTFERTSERNEVKNIPKRGKCKR
jgi:hypothetical protein